MTNRESWLRELDQLMRRQSPEAVADAVAACPGELDETLDLVFETICAGFEPGRTQGERGVFHYRVVTSRGGADRYVRVADGRYEVTRGYAGEPDTTVTVDLVDMLKMVVGRITGSEAFLAGRMTITGDIYFAMNWSDWFTSPRRSSAG